MSARTRFAALGWGRVPRVGAAGGLRWRRCRQRPPRDTDMPDQFGDESTHEEWPWALRITNSRELVALLEAVDPSDRGLPRFIGAHLLPALAGWPASSVRVTSATGPWAGSSARQSTAGNPSHHAAGVVPVRWRSVLAPMRVGKPGTVKACRRIVVRAARSQTRAALTPSAGTHCDSRLAGGAGGGRR